MNLIVVCLPDLKPELCVSSWPGVRICDMLETGPFFLQTTKEILLIEMINRIGNRRQAVMAPQKFLP